MWWIFPVVVLILGIVAAIIEDEVEIFGAFFLFALMLSAVIAIFALFTNFSETYEITMESKELRAYNRDGIYLVENGAGDYEYIVDGLVNTETEIISVDNDDEIVYVERERDCKIEFYTIQYYRTSGFWKWMFGDKCGAEYVQTIYVTEDGILELP